MTNLSEDFASLHGVLKAGQATAVLGREVTLNNGEELVTGVVESVTGGEFPQVLVGGRFHDYDSITSVSIVKEAAQ
jgi:hypothetical protein